MHRRCGHECRKPAADVPLQCQEQPWGEQIQKKRLTWPSGKCGLWCCLFLLLLCLFLVLVSELHLYYRMTLTEFFNFLFYVTFRDVSILAHPCENLAKFSNLSSSALFLLWKVLDYYVNLISCHASVWVVYIIMP